MWNREILWDLMRYSQVKNYELFCGSTGGWASKIARQERQGETELNWLGEGRVTRLLDHEFLKESYDWQSHAAVLCVHTSHCSAATARTHSQTNAHSGSVVFHLCVCVIKTP